ncbi:MAG: DNA polymerase III subunit delta [Bacillota bacterium]|nr:DNA polymerase III subunit delta [Bacillota bacterium]
MKKSKDYKNLILLHGDEVYLQERFMQSLKKKHINDESMSYLKIDKLDDNIDEIINFLNTMSFSMDKKIAVVEDCDFLSSKGKLSEKTMDKLSKFIENNNTDNFLVFLGKDIKIDKRKKLFKLLKKQGDVVEYKKYSEKDLINWISRYLDHFDKNTNYTNARLIAHYSGYLEYESKKTLYDVKNELDKIIAYTQDSYNVSQEDIEKVMSISIDNNIFIFIDNIFENKPSKAYEMFNDMISNNISPHYIFYMLVRQIRMLNQLSAYKESNLREDYILSKMKLRSFIYKKLNYQYNILGDKKIRYLSEKAQDIEGKAKTGLIDIGLGINILISEANK